MKKSLVLLAFVALYACQKAPTEPEPPSPQIAARSSLQKTGYTSVELFEPDRPTQAQINHLCHMPAASDADAVYLFSSDQKTGVICVVKDKGYVV